MCADAHLLPVLMYYVVNIADGVVAQFTVSTQVSQIFLADILPPAVWLDFSVLSGVAAPAERFAIECFVLPRLAALDVVLMVNLQNDLILASSAVNT